MNVPSTEAARLAALARYELTDAAWRASLAHITELVANALNVASAQVNIIHATQQETVADYNWPSEPVARDTSFCAATIQLDAHEAILEVTDASRDARFQNNALVIDAPRIRYYAGTSLRTPDGHAVGSLCVMDTQPRASLSLAERTVLERFASLVMNEFERQRAARQLQKLLDERHTQELRMHDLLNHTSELIVIQDRTRGIVALNPAAASLLGPLQHVLGRRAEDLLGTVPPQARDADERVLQLGEHVRFEAEVTVGGRSRRFQVTKFPMLSRTNAQGVITVLRDVTEHEDLMHAFHLENANPERRVRKRRRAPEDFTLRDPLTGLSNRQAFDLAFDAALQRGHAVHLAVFDLDELKRVNDEFGHTRGDATLVAFADALTRCAPDGALVFRFGGDEFAVITEDGDEPNWQDITSRAVQQTFDAGFPLKYASCGSASFPRDAHDGSDVLRLADQRMMREKIARRSERHLQAPAWTPAPGVVLQAIQATLNLVSRDGELNDDAWKGLLEAAVASIPGAEAGSLTVREAHEFAYRAQVGFSNALLGMRLSERMARAWHGHDGWESGQARLIRGDQVVRHSRAVVPTEEQRAVYEQHGALRHLKANVSVPVVLNGTVVAELNVDNMRYENAFDETSLRVAEAFAAQAAALIATSRRRAAEAARRRELEVPTQLSDTLREARTPSDIHVTLCREAGALLGTNRAAFLHRRDERAAWNAVRFPHHSPVKLSADDAATVPLSEPLVMNGGPLARVLFGEDDVTLLLVPSRVDGATLGVVVTARARGGTFSDPDKQLMAVVASAGASAIRRVQAEQDRAARMDELRLLADFARLSGVLDDPSEIARQCLRAGRAFLGADMAGYIHLTRGAFVSDGDVRTELANAIQTLAGDRARLGPLLAQHGPLIATPSYATLPDPAPSLVQAGVGGIVQVPVVERGRRVGFVGFTWYRSLPDLPSAAEHVAMRISELIGRALERAAFIEELKDTHEGALLALGLSLEMRDFETHGHTERVVLLATEFGRRAGLSGDELEGFRQGAYLHDVGKLAVPDAVLLKPGKLDAIEWRWMQSHADVGARMIQRVPTVHALARDVVRHHHEWWNGRGYPDELVGTQIPLVARLFSLVDVFDALTNARPYKPAWTPREAVVEIERLAGVQFDPHLTPLFVRLLEESGRA